MKRTLEAMLMAAVFVSALGARGTTLPDACGNDKVQFDVTTTKKPQPLGSPAAGKARVVLLEVLDRNLACWSCGKPTNRYGLDGNWVGATQGSSYFAIDVEPGEHHLCTSWQSAFGTLREKVGVAQFTAEAGRTYYFEARVKLKEYSSGGDSGSVDRDLNFGQVNDDEGKFRLKTSALATAVAKN